MGYIYDSDGDPITDGNTVVIDTARDIIKAAMREGNLIALGDNVSGDAATEGLAMLNRIIASVLGMEVGEQITEWPLYADNIAADWSRPVANARLIFTAGSPTTIYMPSTVSNGARMSFSDNGLGFADTPVTLDGAGRNFLNGAATALINVTGTTETYMYRQDVSQWVLVGDLTINDPMPFPLDCSDFFITRLAMRLNPRYGRSLSQELADATNRGLSQLRARYQQKTIVGVDAGLLNLTGRRSIIGGLALSGEEF